MSTSITRWTKAEVIELFEMPFMDLVFKAQNVHRQHFNPNQLKLTTLLSIKTGTCPEDCGYCSQSAHYNTGLKKEKLLDVERVLEDAKRAKANGSTRFCMGAAWRSPPKKDLPKVIEIIKAVKALGLETCVTLGMLDEEQAKQLKESGLDYYSHNIDTSPEHYKKIITTRTFEDRLNTLENVRNAGINVCCGGIMGMGELREDRVEFLLQLANLSTPPESVPINRLMVVKGTPLQDAEPIDGLEFIRTIAVARILMPTSDVRLGAGRNKMTEEMQALCFMAGANSIFIGDVLLTTPNPHAHTDTLLLHKLGMVSSQLEQANA